LGTPTDPFDAEGNPQQSRQSVHAFDCTIAAPKSVSLMRALTDSTTEKVMGAANKVAAQAAFDYLGEHAGYTRVTNSLTGKVELQKLPGLVGAAFQHETSRDGDPHLHLHLIVFNRQPRGDGKLVTIDSESLQVAQRPPGAQTQGQLTAQCAARLQRDLLPLSKTQVTPLQVPTPPWPHPATGDHPPRALLAIRPNHFGRIGDELTTLQRRPEHLHVLADHVPEEPGHQHPHSNGVATTARTRESASGQTGVAEHREHLRRRHVGSIPALGLGYQPKARGCGRARLRAVVLSSRKPHYPRQELITLACLDTRQLVIALVR
jgi:hypothetical protein